MKRVLIVGHGGHSKVIADILFWYKDIHLIGFIDDKYSNFQRENEYYVGPLKSYRHFLNLYEDLKLIVGIGNNKIRKEITDIFNLPKERYQTLIHPSAIISPKAKIGYGSIVMPKAVINTDSRIGDHVIINTGAIVEHDNRIEDFVHISPNVTLTGNTLIREGATIGASATIIPLKEIGEWATIGAGSVVIQDIPPFLTAVGTPAKIINKVGGSFVRSNT